MTIIFRIENACGEGMYHNNLEDVPKIAIDQSDTERHPGPMTDSLFRENYSNQPRSLSKFHFGFTTIEQLRNWLYMDEYLIDLDKKGFGLSIYEVSSAFVIRGYTQAAFLRNEAKLVSVENIIKYFKIKE